MSGVTVPKPIPYNVMVSPALAREVTTPARLTGSTYVSVFANSATTYCDPLIMEAVGAQGVAKSRMVVLTALLRLRQVCCDLRLLKLDNVNPVNASGKLDMFGELLEEVIDGGHRLLVFSQFVGMLTLLKEKLTAEGIEF